MSKFLNEFKQFAMKGNVMDMAIGVIIGGAFGKIVSSLVDDIIMPLVGTLIGGFDFTSLKLTLPSWAKLGEGAQQATLNYGNFLQQTVDFLIIAFSIFVVIRLVNKVSEKMKKEEVAEVPAEPAEPEVPAVPEDIQLLREIRDSLKK